MNVWTRSLVPNDVVLRIVVITPMYADCHDACISGVMPAAYTSLSIAATATRIASWRLRGGSPPAKQRMTASMRLSSSWGSSCAETRLVRRCANLRNCVSSVAPPKSCLAWGSHANRVSKNTVANRSADGWSRSQFSSKRCQSRRVTRVDVAWAQSANETGLTRRRSRSPSSTEMNSNDMAVSSGIGIDPIGDRAGGPYSRILGECRRCICIEAEITRLSRHVHRSSQSHLIEPWLVPARWTGNQFVVTYHSPARDARPDGHLMSEAADATSRPRSAEWGR